MSDKKKANETTTSVRKDMRIDKELLAKIDDVRGDVPFAAWVKRAIKMRLEGLEQIAKVESVPVNTRADVKNNITAKAVLVRTQNELRAEKTRQLLFSAINSLSQTEKVEILNARYPKSKCRKAIGEVVSKDSIAKYWDDILSYLTC